MHCVVADQSVYVSPCDRRKPISRRPEYVHLVVTRFNIETSFSDGRCLNKDWLKTRLDIFEKYCLSSIRKQTPHDFIWLILIHPESPRAMIERLMAANRSPVRLHLLSSAGRPDQAIIKWSKIASSIDSEYVITTRLDSDDALFTDYIARVQNEFRRQHRTVISFPNGSTYSPDTGRLLRYRDEAGPFLSLIERYDEHMVTAYGTKHHNIARLGAVKEIEEEMSWLQVINGTNVANREQGEPVAGDSSDVLRNRFGAAL